MRQANDDRTQSFFLLKTEPDDYSFEDLKRDNSTVWDGVGNYAALKHMREARKGDLALIYHTGRERAVVGVARIISDAYPDPQRDDGDPKFVVFDVEPVEPLETPVTLKEIKDDDTFDGSDLVRQARLSAMVLPPEQWERILEMGGTSL